MLTESEVIEAVRRFLERNSFRVTRCLSETEQGIDIEAFAPDGKQRVAIEAKGETSSKPHTNRYGKPFSTGQVVDHVSKALYCAARDCSTAMAGIAFPKTVAHVNCVQTLFVDLTPERPTSTLFVDGPAQPEPKSDAVMAVRVVLLEIVRNSVES